jgi:hypothetical protein
LSEPGLNRLKDSSDFYKSNPKNLINLFNLGSDKIPGSDNPGSDKIPVQTIPVQTKFPFRQENQKIICTFAHLKRRRLLNTVENK